MPVLLEAPVISSGKYLLFVKIQVIFLPQRLVGNSICIGCMQGKLAAVQLVAVRFLIGIFGCATQQNRVALDLIISGLVFLGSLRRAVDRKTISRLEFEVQVIGGLNVLRIAFNQLITRIAQQNDAVGTPFARKLAGRLRIVVFMAGSNC